MIYGPLEGCSADGTSLPQSRLNSLGAESHTENMDLAIGGSQSVSRFRSVGVRRGSCQMSVL